MNSYLGYMWWDEETDGELMYPEQAEVPDRRGVRRSRRCRNPDEAAARGNCGPTRSSSPTSPS